jgi:hypothetical protein
LRFSKFLVGEGFSFDFAESADALFKLIVSVEGNDIDEFPFGLFDEFVHFELISVFLEIHGSSGEDCNASSLEGEEHLIED